MITIDHLTPPTTPKKPRRKSQDPFSPSTNEARLSSDRFIPNRSKMDIDQLSYALQAENDNATNDPNMKNIKAGTPASRDGTPSRHVKDELTVSPKRLMDCFDKQKENSGRPPLFTGGIKSVFQTSETVELSSGSAQKKTTRSLPTGPSRVLEAPELMDDYYLNLLHWGNNNMVAIALKKSVYLWNAANCKVTQLLTLSDDTDYVSSLQWNPRDNTIAVGTNSTNIQLWDSTEMRCIRELSGHSLRVSSMTWNDQCQLTSGGRDSRILNWDIRCPAGSSAITHSYEGHENEICGLAWSPDGKTLASGGNENYLCIWDANMSASRHSNNNNSNNNNSSTRSSQVFRARLKFTQHQAAVKALAWCPWQRNILASGGGTADRTIRIWNTMTGVNVKYVDTHSQVCAIQWNEVHKEIVSSHGFSDNQLILWSYPTMKKIREFRGHTARVLHMSQSPDRTTIVSASADETLRFWEMFGSSASSTHSRSSSSGSSSSTSASTSATNSPSVSVPSTPPRRHTPSSSTSTGVDYYNTSTTHSSAVSTASSSRGMLSPTMTYSLNKGLTSSQATAGLTLR